VGEHAPAVRARTQAGAGWAARRRAGAAGSVRVGMIDAAATIHCADALAAFRRDRPDVDLHLQVSPSSELLRDLAAARLDVVVCVQPAALPDGVMTTALVDEDLAVYAPRDGAPRAWGPWVTYPVGSETRALVVDALRHAGRRVTIVAESHQPDVLAQMVALGIGWSVLPVAQVERFGVALRRVGREAFAQRTLVLARRADGPTDPTVDALADYVDGRK
jgi:DNA-binding transcriptional LysR family regulator